MKFPYHTLKTLTTKRVRFGNFIGEAEESEEESQDGAQTGGYVYDEEDDEEAPLNDQQLMQIDGMHLDPSIMSEY